MFVCDFDTYKSHSATVVRRTVGRVIGYIRRHRGSFPKGPRSDPVPEPREGTHRLSVDGQTVSASGGRADASAYALAAAHATAPARSPATYEGNLFPISLGAIDCN